MAYDMIIRGATRYDDGTVTDVAIKDGFIVQTGILEKDATAKEVIEAEHLLLSPGFIDSHVHLDKTRSLGQKESPTLSEAIRAYSDYFLAIPPGSVKEDIKKRARATLRRSLSAGTTTVRTHVNLIGERPLEPAEALHELREELKPYIDIQITALPNFSTDESLNEERYRAIEEGLKRGIIDCVGGGPHIYPHMPNQTERLFEIAALYDKPIDLHIDEHDMPDIKTFVQTAQLTKVYRYEGRVVCGHVTGLNAVSDDVAKDAIAQAKEADLSIITLPSCNLYLMGRTDKQPIRRGVTRIREFIDADVNIAYASDNIRDPFRPIGNGDMLEEGILCGQVAQMLTKSDLEVIYRMGTVCAAKALMLEHYGIDEGCQADLVLIDAASVSDALVNQSTRTHVIKRGRVVAKNTCESEVIF